ncbi:MAG: hypothetical protein ACI9VR_004755 [Cognaticolwellia sp.]|jgi:hypothetical protein
MLILLGLLACGADPTIINGNVAGETMGEPLTAMWGGPFIVFVKDQLDCRDLDFTRRTYDQGNAPVDFNMVALQFSFDAPDVSEGVFSTEGTDAVVDAKTLIVSGGAFNEVRDRTGTINVSSVVDRDPLEGSFDVTFSDDEGSFSTGYFYAEYCINLIQ